MKRKDRDPDLPIGKLKEVPDFLPHPAELAKSKTKIIVTIGLDKETVEFFKKQAKTNRTKYQKMIREVLDRYAEHYKEAA